MASSRKHSRLLSEQNCLGITSPEGVLVSDFKRLPSPAAKITAQVFELISLMSVHRDYFYNGCG
jgi:hypothetical protein